MTIHVFGDSHAVSGFGRIAEAEIHWIGALTMHRIGRDGAQQLFEGVTVGPGDVLIFVYGEVDVRAHILRLARQLQKSPSELVRDLADRYAIALFMASLRRPGVTFMLTSVVPPASWFAAYGNVDLPVYGSLRKRVRITRELNARLKSHAEHLGLRYFDYTPFYEARHGGLRFELSDSHVHINAESAEPIARALEMELGLPLTFLPAEAAKVSLHIERHSFGCVVWRSLKRECRVWLARFLTKPRL